MWLLFVFKVAMPGNRLQYKRLELERQARLIFQKPHWGTIFGLDLSECGRYLQILKCGWIFSYISKEQASPMGLCVDYEKTEGDKADASHVNYSAWNLLANWRCRSLTGVLVPNLESFQVNLPGWPAGTASQIGGLESTSHKLIED